MEVKMNTDAISLTAVRKSFDTIVAVDDVSLDVHRGEVFGLLGPNGAGKTTLIRMMMDIIRPDSGRVYIFGHQLTAKDKERIGYLPEERGLYVRQKVLSVLEYLARLKGLDQPTAHRNALSWLERLEMTEVKDKKVRELSKGNQQKIQLIATLVADPEIVILDEPFSGLDPVNTRAVSTLIRELAASGKTVLLSTHQMGLVETLCERVFMINRGRRVFYGNLDEIKRQYSDNAVLIKSNVDYPECDLIARKVVNNGSMKVYLREGIKPRDFLNWLIEAGVEVDLFQRATSPLEDIYVKVVEESRIKQDKEPKAAE
jgi:ABC-2 type transport system ATP-binding protein